MWREYDWTVRMLPLICGALFLTNPMATLKLLYPLSTTLTIRQCGPTMAMQCILAIRTQCLLYRQDISIILLHKRILFISNGRITGNLRMSILELPSDLMRTQTRQHGQNNLLNLTVAGRMKMTISFTDTETLTLSKSSGKYYHRRQKVFPRNHNLWPLAYMELILIMWKMPTSL